MNRVILHIDGAVVYDSGATPTPTPTPTPVPTPPGVVMVPLPDPNTTQFLSCSAGVTYCWQLPSIVIGSTGFLQVGQGRGVSPSRVQLAVSGTPGGGIGSQPPNGASGDANAGVTVYWSTNPIPDRGGSSYQAKVTPGVTAFVSLTSDGGDISYYYVS